jgi:hypothetical protein
LFERKLSNKIFLSTVSFSISSLSPYFSLFLSVSTISLSLSIWFYYLCLSFSLCLYYLCLYYLCLYYLCLFFYLALISLSFFLSISTMSLFISLFLSTSTLHKSLSLLFYSPLSLLPLSHLSPHTFFFFLSLSHTNYLSLRYLFSTFLSQSISLSLCLSSVSPVCSF